jgi:tetratricopeptide (TPR) repeat protein
MRCRVALVVLAVSLAAAPRLPAAPLACHGMQMFDTTGLPPEPVRTGIGTSDFTITTPVPKARQMMQQGMALLHDFWHFEAYRSFLEVVRLDPKSPMGYFGVYLVYKEFGKTYESKAKAQLDEALKRIDRASEHERYYLRAAKAQVDKDDHIYHREMGTLIDRFPDDIDAKLLLAAHLQNGYDEEGRPTENQVYGQAILESVLAQHPDHVGANHYFVHAFEGSPHPQTALAAAEKLPRLGPSSAHLVHMPGHIYYRMGDYAKARRAFEAAMRVDEAYLTAEHVHVGDDWNYPHNLAYLIATCAEDGRYAEGPLEGSTLLEPVVAQLGERLVGNHRCS